MHGDDLHYKLRLNVSLSAYGTLKITRLWLDVKAETFMVNYKFNEARKITINKVGLIGSQSAYPVKDGEYADDLIVGHPFWPVRRRSSPRW